MRARSSMKTVVRSPWVGCALLLLLGGCSVAGVFRKPGAYHTIQPGETLYRIARTYRVDLDELVKVNHIADSRRIDVGTRLFIPRAVRVLKVPPRRKPPRRERTDQVSRKTPTWPGRRNVERESSRRSSSGSRVPSTALRTAKPPKQVARVTLPAEVDFIWPVKGKISSFYGKRGKRRYQGIDIVAATGTPVRAAEDGYVIFSGKGPGGYGLMVILRHPKGFHSIYAHNSKNIVKKGSKVRQGEVIALVGETGRIDGPHLHFEIRNRTKPKDPLFYLP